jgi:hypothetical protein
MDVNSEEIILDMDTLDYIPSMQGGMQGGMQSGMQGGMQGGMMPPPNSANTNQQIQDNSKASQ